MLKVRLEESDGMSPALPFTTFFAPKVPELTNDEQNIPLSVYSLFNHVRFAYRFGTGTGRIAATI
jgi:hypothetical protein